MSQNFSTLTFRDLDLLTNQWISELNDWQELFDRQAAELIDWDIEVDEHTESLQILNGRLNFCKCLESQIHQSILAIDKSQHEVEIELTELEDEINACRNYAPFDENRWDVYKHVLDSQITLLNQGTFLDQFYKFEKRCTLQNPPLFEIISLMENNLASLEKIEFQILNLKKSLNSLDYLEELTLRNLNIKKCPLF